MIMTNEFLLRRKTDPESDWIDVWTRWGFRVTDESKDLFSLGEIQAYDYQFIDSNIRTYIPIKDENDKIVRECTTCIISIYTDYEMMPEDFTTIKSAWDNFIEYISGYEIEFNIGNGLISNTFTVDGEISPTPTIDSNGLWTHLTSGITFKQMKSW